MGFNLNGTLMGKTGTAFAVTPPGNSNITLDPTGRLLRQSPAASVTPMFNATNTTNGWISLSPNDTWLVCVFNSAGQNRGSCYNTSNGRFTAPIQGLYMFSANGYAYNNYTHPIFFVNGSQSARRPGGGYYPRLRGHSHAAGHSHDNNCSEVIYLYVGDYVEYRLYGGGSGTNIPGWYGVYSQYSGVLLA